MHSSGKFLGDETIKSQGKHSCKNQKSSKSQNMSVYFIFSIVKFKVLNRIII